MNHGFLIFEKKRNVLHSVRTSWPNTSQKFSHSALRLSQRVYSLNLKKKRFTHHNAQVLFYKGVTYDVVQVINTHHFRGEKLAGVKKIRGGCLYWRELNYTDVDKIWIGPDRITDRITDRIANWITVGSRIGSRIMDRITDWITYRITDRIMLDKIRNFAWPTNIKSAWHDWAQAQPHGSKTDKGFWKIKWSNSLQN